MQAVAAQILDKCDALDGVKDGVMEDPRQCKVDVSTLTGLSAAQMTALKAIYAPTRAGGETVFPAQPFGGEGEAAGWPAWITGAVRPGQPPSPSLRYGFGTNLFKYIVFNDPDWDYRTYDLSTWKKDTAKTASWLNATNPNLDAFKAGGHKLLLWHGWSDAGLSPLGDDQVLRQRQGARSESRRLRADVPDARRPALRRRRRARTMQTGRRRSTPGSKAARRRRGSSRRRAAAANPTRTRPLCAYPQHAVYNGSGSTDQAENFTCKP